MRMMRRPFSVPPAVSMRRGVGQVNPCPSVEQLMGIQDSNDPCQSAASTGGSVSISPAGMISVIPGTTTPAATAPSTSSIGTWISQNPMLAIGGLILTAFVISGIGRK